MSSAYGGLDDMDRDTFDWWEKIGSLFAEDFKTHGGVDSQWAHQQVGMHIVKLVEEIKSHPNQDFMKSLIRALK